jgi:uncharacterized membrane protein
MEARKMGDFQASTTVDADANALFDYLSQVSNLPRYFARMTSAEPGDGAEVHTVARMPDGKQVAGDAWFTVDPVTHRIEWGSEGPNDYRGSLEVSSTSSGAEVRAQLHTTRVADDNAEVQQGLEETLATVKQLVEQQAAAV